MPSPKIPKCAEVSTLFAPTNRESIGVLERRLDFVFPEDFKLFLLQRNGISLLSDIEFPLKNEFDDMEALELSKIFGVGDENKAFSIQWCISVPGFRDRTPGDLVPIGSDSNSFFICYRRRKRAPDIVVFADYGFDGRPWTRAELLELIVPVASTFDEFLTSLRPASNDL